MATAKKSKRVRSAKGAEAAGRLWTCPFCALLCDDLRVRETAPGGAWAVVGGGCPSAEAGLANLGRPAASAPRAWVDGRPAALDDALAAAAQRLAGWRQPLIGGLGTDVAGARALFRLAARIGAICDHADGRGLMHGVRAQQDRGLYYATLGEVRDRADLIVCAGTSVSDHYPGFFSRIGLDDDASPCTRLVFLDAPAPIPATAGLPSRCDVRTVHAAGDLFADLQQLGALVGQPDRAGADADLAALATELLAARYAVLVWEAATLPEHGALIVEALARIVDTLNRGTRAAMCSLGGGDGAYSVNQAFTWLSGLPLRTRVAHDALEHDPHRFDAQRLIDRHGSDGVLWVSSFRADRLPPATALPRIVLGPPAMAQRLVDAGNVEALVFIAVATPGVNAPGHLFRTDGSIVVPLEPLVDDGLPGVAEVVARWEALL